MADIIAALKKIELGEGAYSRDPLKHASNCIENMQRIARETLKELGDTSSYMALKISTDGDVEGDLPRRIATGPMNLTVYIREDVVAEMVRKARTSGE